MRQLIASSFFFVVTFCANVGTAQDQVQFANIGIRGSISDELATFVATQSIKSQSLRTSGRIEDLVRETCGFVSQNNVSVFEKTVAWQGGDTNSDGRFSVESDYTLVPACLPDEREYVIVGRLPSASDTLSQFYEFAAGGGFYQALETVDQTQVDSRQAIEFATIAITEREETLRRLSSSLGSTAESLGFDEAPESNVVEATTSHMQQLSLDPNDRSRVAYEAFAVSSALIDAGAPQFTVQNVVRRALEDLGAQDVDEVIADIEIAINTRQSVPKINEIPILQQRCAALGTVCSAEASGIRLRLDALPANIATQVNPVARVPDINTIFRSVPVNSVEPVAKTARIQVQPETIDFEGVAFEMAPAIDPSKITLFLNVFDAVADNSSNHCSEGDYAHWGTTEFEQSFRASVEASLGLKAEIFGTANDEPTNVIVLDGGFFRFEDQSFGGADWLALTREDQHSVPESFYGMSEDRFEKIVHGTAVTSLVLGGPGLMNMSRELELPIMFNVKPIYRSEPAPQPEGTRYTLIENVATAILNAEADIANLSFGSRDDDDVMLHQLKSAFGSPQSALLVVAAGNLGSNDRPTGEEILSMGILPQGWGTVAPNNGQGPWSMIVVAAIDPQPDPSKLAWFSNFGNDVVAIGAPGCNVRALRASSDATYVEDTFNGTSFAAPIVTFVAATVRSLLPPGRRSAPWVRARVLSTADIEFGVAGEKIAYGRVLNPVAATNVYRDIVTTFEPFGTLGRVIVGEITEMSGSTTIAMGAACEGGFAQTHDLLRLFIQPEALYEETRKWRADLMVNNTTFRTVSCRLKDATSLDILTDDGLVTIPLSRIEDIKFSFNRGVE